MSHSPNVLPTKSLQKKNKCLVLHTPAAKKLKCSDNEQSLKDNPNLINSSSETPPSPLMSRASKSSLARSRGSNLVQSRSGSRTYFINLSPCSVFSCPQQLNRTHCLSVCRAPLTIREFTTLQSDPRDL